MTKVATTLRSAYLAGPMRGLPEYNFPAFHKATKKLRADGWKILSPAERDEADDSINHDQDRAGWADHLGLDYFMQFDLAMVCQTDAVICLPNWERSQGARLETAVAVEVGHPVFEYVPRPFGRYELEAVNPAYVRLVFFGEGAPDITMEEAAEEKCQCYGSEQDKTEDGCWCDDNRTLVEVAGSEFDRAVELEVADGPEEFFEQLDGLVLNAGPVDEGPTTLPTDTAGRKAVPLATGVLDYFPAALAEVARVSKAGNDKHNPGQPMHHARGKSTDHADCLLRHLVDRGKVDPETGQRHSGEVAWRALALLQQELEDEGLAPMPRGARFS